MPFVKKFVEGSPCARPESPSCHSLEYIYPFVSSRLRGEKTKKTPGHKVTKFFLIPRSLAVFLTGWKACPTAVCRPRFAVYLAVCHLFVHSFPIRWQLPSPLHPLASNRLWSRGSGVFPQCSFPQGEQHSLAHPPQTIHLLRKGHNRRRWESGSRQAPCAM